MSRVRSTSARVVAIVWMCAGCSSLLGVEEIGYAPMDATAPPSDAPPSADANPDAGPGPDAPSADAGPDTSIDAGPSPDAALARAIREDMPIAYFPLDEGAAASAVKDVISGVQGAIIGQVQLGIPGIAGGSAGFPDSQNDFVSIVSTAFDFKGTAPFTVELWARPRFAPDSGQLAFLPFSRQSGSNGYSFFFNATGTSANVQFGVGDGVGAVAASGAVSVVSDDGGLRATTWVYLVGTFSGSVVELYIDSAPVTPQTLPADGGRRPTGTTAPLKIGFAFLGEVDEVAVYDKVLSPARIQAHYLAR